MTNETYLNISYFGAFILGLILANITFLILRKPLKEATCITEGKNLSSLIRRIFPSWLILTVLLAFISVSYFDCSHESYKEIVADRAHLINKTQEHISRMSMFLVIALLTYSFLLAGFLWSAARMRRRSHYVAKLKNLSGFSDKDIV